MLINFVLAVSYIEEQTVIPGNLFLRTKNAKSSCGLLYDTLRKVSRIALENKCSIQYQKLLKSSYNQINFNNYSLYSESIMRFIHLGSDLRQKGKIRGSTEIHLLELFIVSQIFIPVLLRKLLFSKSESEPKCLQV